MLGVFGAGGEGGEARSAAARTDREAEEGRGHHGVVAPVADDPRVVGQETVEEMWASSVGLDRERLAKRWDVAYDVTVAARPAEREVPDELHELREAAEQVAVER